MELSFIKDDEGIVEPAKKKFKASLAGDKKVEDVRTPKKLYDELNKEFDFNFDPCPSDPAWMYNGLKMEWKERNFVNPPFSEISKWLEKGVAEMQKFRKSVFLITFRPNTKYWNEWVYPHASDIRILQGNIQFDGYAKTFPVPIGIIVFDPLVKSAWSFTKKENYSYWSANSKK